jgi:hypothetical protein
MQSANNEGVADADGIVTSPPITAFVMNSAARTKNRYWGVFILYFVEVPTSFLL